LAAERDHAEVRQFAGINVISLGVRFQMFNAAFLAGPVWDERDLESRITAASVHFRARGIAWSFWLCDGLLPDLPDSRVARIFHKLKLRQTSEMPGMLTADVAPASRSLPDCLIRPVESSSDLESFRHIGSLCFNVPRRWFDEVFDDRMLVRPGFRPWIALVNGEPAAAAATVTSNDSLGIYNVGVLPHLRRRGYAEAIVRQCIEREQSCCSAVPIVLQSTSSGLNLYVELGFEVHTRFRVWIS
jgi:GNAT superfamily N-acetyltransferase